jgi:hypothetical protein
MVDKELEYLIGQYGPEATVALLKEEIHRKNAKDTLTIIANEGTHHLPEVYRRGEIYVVTKGNLDFSSVDKVKSQYEIVLSDLSDKLKSQIWHKIYLVPFGHSTLCMQIKLLVFRITRIETTDLFYSGNGNYADLAIDQRTLINEGPI